MTRFLHDTDGDENEREEEEEEEEGVQRRAGPGRLIHVQQPPESHQRAASCRSPAAQLCLFHLRLTSSIRLIPNVVRSTAGRAGPGSRRCKTRIWGFG